MKNTFLLVSVVLLFLVFSVIGIFYERQSMEKQIKTENSKYEVYLHKTILGSEVMSLINQAINQNEENDIEKNNEGYYISNNDNSIQIMIKMTSVGKDFWMEDFYKRRYATFY